MGCEGCELWNHKTGDRTCYAGVLHRRYGGKTKGFSPTFDEVTLWPGRMAEATKWSDLKWTDRKDKPWLNGLARLIFVSDMSDALSSVIPLEYLEEQVIRTASSPAGLRHHWLWLTKRPERMAQLSDLLRVKGERWPANLWAGTSITSQGTIGRINSLLKVGDDETFRFLSVEPQRERIDFGDRLSALDWVIQGGESGAGATPFELEWASDLIDQCKRADTAYFLKQLGSVVHEDGLRKKFADGHAGDWSEWPMRLRVRELRYCPSFALLNLVLAIVQPL